MNRHFHLVIVHAMLQDSIASLRGEFPSLVRDESCEVRCIAFKDVREIASVKVFAGLHGLVNQLKRHSRGRLCYTIHSYPKATGVRVTGLTGSGLSASWRR